MARKAELEPTPDAKESGPDFGESIRRLPHALKKNGSGRANGLATSEQYEKLLLDRPLKLTAGQVNYHEGSEEEGYCKNCFHFYERKADGHTVCEIFRPDTASEDVDPEFTCLFQTDDGEAHPNLDGAKVPSRKEAKNGSKTRS